MTYIEENTFAAACYNNNTIEELEEMLEMGADTTDCETWNITETEWIEQINLAITALKEDA